MIGAFILDQSSLKSSGLPPKRILVVFAFVLTPVGLGLATKLAYEVYADSKKGQVQGVVRDVRVFVAEHPPSRRAGSWLKEWLVDYDTVRGPSRQWFPVGRYRTNWEAQADRDIGKTILVWYSPDAREEATIVPPEALQKCLWAGWSAIIGVAGIICTYSFIRRRTGRRT